MCKTNGTISPRPHHACSRREGLFSRGGNNFHCHQARLWSVRLFPTAWASDTWRDCKPDFERTSYKRVAWFATINIISLYQYSVPATRTSVNQTGGGTCNWRCVCSKREQYYCSRLKNVYQVSSYWRHRYQPLHNHYEAAPPHSRAANVCRTAPDPLRERYA